MAPSSFGAWRSRKRRDFKPPTGRRLVLEPLEDRCLLASTPAKYDARQPNSPIEVDGRLDEPAWKTAVRLRDFYVSRLGRHCSPSRPRPFGCSGIKTTFMSASRSSTRYQLREARPTTVISSRAITSSCSSSPRRAIRLTSNSSSTPPATCLTPSTRVGVDETESHRAYESGLSRAITINGTDGHELGCRPGLGPRGRHPALESAGLRVERSVVLPRCASRLPRLR